MFLLLYVMIAFLKKINHYNTHTEDSCTPLQILFNIFRVNQIQFFTINGFILEVWNSI